MNAKVSDAMDDVARMKAVLAAQKQAFLQNPNADVALRIERLKKLREVFISKKDEFCKAISADFTNRSEHETLFGELLTVTSHMDLTIKHLPQWVKDESRPVTLLHQPASAHVQYQPMGTVGIISPWNYPIVLSIGPLICALAAGNHVMMKPSSSVPRYTALLAEQFERVFAENLVHVVQGSGNLSAEFSKLPFDQLTFTAAENLTPVLLELGGKSPAIIHSSYNYDEAAARLVFGKFWNAGQTCVAPDYVMVPKGHSEVFASAVERRLQHCYPSLKDNRDYTSMINERQKQTVLGILEDARAKGATVLEVNPANDRMEDSQKIAPHLVWNASEDMRIAQEEIFGPLMLIREYDTVQDALSYVASKPRPLAMYYFDNDERRAQQVQSVSTSGHLGINQTLTHVTQDALPFGGVGNSGMGKYHGLEGFRTMSHSRSVMRHGLYFPMRPVSPPFNKMHDLLLKGLVR